MTAAAATKTKPRAKTTPRRRDRPDVSGAFASEETKQLQRKAAIAKRWHGPDEVNPALQAWAASRIADFARFTLQDSPLPLTDEQVAEIVDVLRTAHRGEA